MRTQEDQRVYVEPCSLQKSKRAAKSLVVIHLQATHSWPEPKQYFSVLLSLFSLSNQLLKGWRTLHTTHIGNLLLQEGNYSPLTLHHLNIEVDHRSAIRSMQHVKIHCWGTNKSHRRCWLARTIQSVYCLKHCLKIQGFNGPFAIPAAGASKGPK